MLFNRFILVRFLSAGVVIGGKQQYDNGQLVVPPSISFEVKHTTEKTPNEASIKIYNASPDTQKKLFVEGATIELEAGYWPRGAARYTGIIFKGQIRDVKTQSEGADVISTLNFGDHDDAAHKRKVRKKHPKGTKHKAIVQAIVAEMNADAVIAGKLDVPDYSEPRARMIDRYAFEELTDIAHQHDLQFSIQDGVFNIYSSDAALNDKSLLLTPDTGLIGSPEFTDKGVNIKTLLIPTLRPGDTICIGNPYIKAPRTVAKYKIEDVTFEGGNFGDSFGCSIEAKIMDGNGKVKRSRNRLAGKRV